MLGKRIKVCRILAGIGQAELGRKIGVTPGTMWKYETGELGVSVPRLLQISEVLDESLDYLATGRGKPRRAVARTSPRKGKARVPPPLPAASSRAQRVPMAR